MCSLGKPNSVKHYRKENLGGGNRRAVDESKEVSNMTTAGVASTTRLKMVTIRTIIVKEIRLSPCSEQVELRGSRMGGPRGAEDTIIFSELLQ